jgi:hypothetical protein
MQVISFLLAGAGISVFAASGGDLQMSAIGIVLVIAGFVLFKESDKK